MRYVVIITVLEKKFLIKRKQVVNNCFKPLISSAFTKFYSTVVLNKMIFWGYSQF